MTKESTTSVQQCQITVDSFSDTVGIMHKELVPPGQTVIKKFCCNDLKWPRENVQSSGAIIRGPYTMTMCTPAHHSFDRNNSHPPMYLPTRPCLRWRGNTLRTMEWSRLNSRTRSRCWHKMTSTSASDQRAPATISVLAQKWAILKHIEANKISVSGYTRAYKFWAEPCTYDRT